MRAPSPTLYVRGEVGYAVGMVPQCLPRAAEVMDILHGIGFTPASPQLLTSHLFDKFQGPAMPVCVLGFATKREILFPTVYITVYIEVLFF